MESEEEAAHLQTVDEEVAIAIAIMESEEARLRCFHCGTRTDNPLRPSIYARQQDNPHIACSLDCLQRVCDWWIVRKHELQQMDEDLPSIIL